MKNLILISAKAQSGKSTFAKYAKERFEVYGYKSCVMNYSSHLKNIIKTYYGWDGVDKSPKFRSLLQSLGTDKIRQQMNKPFFHVNRLCEDSEIISDDFDFILVDDARFKGELYYPMAYFPDKVKTIRLVRNNFVSPLTFEQQNHISEIDLDNEKFEDIFSIESGEEYVKQCAFEYVDRLVESYE